jgi:uncharacterized coiled-coil protein SlyX
LIRFAILKHVIETLQAKLAETKDALAETKDVQALLTAQLEAMQKQMADMFQIMQAIGQASGVQVRMPDLVLVRHFTPVSTPSCRWDCRPSCHCDFWPSCYWDCRPSCHCFVGLRAVVSCRLESSPCRGGAAEIFNFESNTCNLFFCAVSVSGFKQPRCRVTEG